MSTAKARTVVLISGRGSNMLSLIEATQAGHCHIDIVGVISNRPDAAGLDSARAAGIETRALDHKAFPSREDFDAALADLIETFEPDLIILAGFMRILTEGFTRRFLGRMLNIHPSLLPKYPGLHTHQRALDAGDKQHGATVHFVTPELDSGPLIVQSQIDIQSGDTAEQLAAKVLGTEHAIYPMAADWFGRGLLKMVDGKVTLCERSLKSPVIFRDGQLEGIDHTCHNELQPYSQAS